MNYTDPAGTGFKSWLVKQALEQVAGFVRGGGRIFVDLADDFLDDSARAAIRRNSVEIADTIEDVAQIPDVATHMVRREVYTRLVRDVGLDPGTAQVIASGVEGVLWFVL